MASIIFPTNNSRRKGRNGGMGLSNKSIMTMLLQLSFILVTAFMIYNVGRSISQTNQKLQILSQAEAEVQQLRLENINLFLESNSTNTDDYIEAEARNRLYYSRPGETQYIIPETMLRRYMNSSASPVVDGEVEGKSTIDAWVDFFTQGI